MSELIQKVDPHNTEAVKSLPETKEQAWVAAENRKAVAELAYESATTVAERIRSTKEPLRLDMGKDRDGNVRFATIGLVNPGNQHNKQLRIKVLGQDGQPETSLVYGGLYHHNRQTDNHVMKEVPTAEVAQVQDISGDTSQNVRSVALEHGLDGDVYRGGDTVRDLGAMDFLAATQIMSAAAEQIRAEDASQNQQAA